MSLFCRASSTVATLPFRAVRSPVSLQTGAQRVTLGGSHQFSRASSLISFSRGSTLTAITADENLVTILESEIASTVVPKDPYDEEEEDRSPAWFPFYIIDTLRERDVCLRRKFEDEIVLVQIVHSPPQDGEVVIGIPMVVNVSKDADGDDGVCLEFVIKAYVDKIVINSVYVQQPHEPTYPYQGPHFEDLDENLKKAFHKFLEIRGITPTITDFLADYLANKDKREHLQWLKDVKSFVNM